MIQLFNYYLQRIQKMDSSPDFLSIIKNFMIDIHSELSQPSIVNHEHINIIDRAAGSLKAAQENICTLQSQNMQNATSRAAVDDYKKQCQHLEKRIGRKTEQIDILKQTVKTLYADNQKIAREKQDLAKEVSALKQHNSSLKKKIKRQDQELGNNKTDLQKLTGLAEERLNEYIKEDQEKQIKLKKMQNQIEKLKADLAKKDKNLTHAQKKLQQMKNIEGEYEQACTMVQTLKHDNKLTKMELQSIKENIHDEKVKYLQENQDLLKQIEHLNEREASFSSEKQELMLKWQSQLEKSQSYEEQIMIRTEKLKQKNRQIKAYNQEIQKLARRVKELSQMADEVMAQNRDLTIKCSALEQKLEEFKVVHSHLGKLSGELSYKKGVELGRMIDYINKLQASL